MRLFLIGATAWYSVGYYFFRNPLQLTEKKRFVNKELDGLIASKRILLIAHRGGSLDSPENTTLAFDRAVSIS